jgi:hypothetical protein
MGMPVAGRLACTEAGVGSIPTVSIPDASRTRRAAADCKSATPGRAGSTPAASTQLPARRRRLVVWTFGSQPSSDGFDSLRRFDRFGRASRRPATAAVSKTDERGDAPCEFDPRPFRSGEPRRRSATAAACSAAERLARLVGWLTDAAHPSSHAGVAEKLHRATAALDHTLSAFRRLRSVNGKHAPFVRPRCGFNSCRRLSERP